ncbi:hypothetical protein GWI33_005482 [Rhynchophorus ferrugineus]|uniref:Uncharacterized protein n=1 Tax=Rhynchophorus ferrugineus TaxID=354439 RepID=A0A834IMW6_RHYFE|nr:hypothetical protein GWI33_005482 [Rhynchophorus ferrugineus]
MMLVVEHNSERSLYNDTEGSYLCSVLQCPPNTSNCEKRSETTSDKRFLTVNVKCMDRSGNITMTRQYTQNNPYGRNVYYKGLEETLSISYRSANIVLNLLNRH